MNAGTPLLPDRSGRENLAGCGYRFIHETRDQLTFLKASSKRAYRISNANQAIAILHKAIQEARTPPCGPVSVEIPIDIQSQAFPWRWSPPRCTSRRRAAVQTTVDTLWAQLRQAKQPLLWLGGAIGSDGGEKTGGCGDHRDLQYSTGAACCRTTRQPARLP
jgi:acetolactate synthase-1/2/3 large subunit